jgi:uncharacterized membrane protein YuzA (DUF378 family)
MLKQACIICKIVGIFAILGALNWGIIGLTGNNIVENVLGAGSGLTKVLYILIGLSGLALIVSFFTVCPKCKK